MDAAAEKPEESAPSGALTSAMGGSPNKTSLQPMRRRTLMERQSDKKSDGGEAFRMSERIIKNTQAMTDSLRAQRGKCQSSINRDTEDLYTIERTLEEYVKGYDKVVVSYAARLKEREVLRAILAKSKTDASALVTSCEDLSANNRRDTYRSSRMIATSTLRAARGFSTGYGTTCTAAEARKRGRRMNSSASKASLASLGSRPSTALDGESTFGGSAASLPNLSPSRPATSFPSSASAGAL
jgi:hypothetical protein